MDTGPEERMTTDEYHTSRLKEHGNNQEGWCRVKLHCQEEVRHEEHALLTDVGTEEPTHFSRFRRLER
eukprot:1927510-Karenia_brevis.AAC.1